MEYGLGVGCRRVYSLLHVPSDLPKFRCRDFPCPRQDFESTFVVGLPCFVFTSDVCVISTLQMGMQVRRRHEEYKRNAPNIRRCFHGTSCSTDCGSDMPCYVSKQFKRTLRCRPAIPSRVVARTLKHTRFRYIRMDTSSRVCFYFFQLTAIFLFVADKCLR